MNRPLPPTFKSTPGKTHLSISGYLTMIARAHRESATAEQMCRAVKRQASAALKRLLAHMVRMGILTISSWVKLSRGKWQPRLRFGGSVTENAPYPGKPGHEFGAKVTTKIPVTLVCLQHMLDEMWSGATIIRIVEVTGMSRTMVLNAIRAGRKLGLFYISSYIPRGTTGGSPLPVFAIRLKAEADVPRPMPRPAPEVGRARRLRRKIRERMAAASNDSRALEAA